MDAGNSSRDWRDLWREIQAQGLFIACGGVLYTSLTLLLDRLGMMPADGFETARFCYNIATGLFGIGIGLAGAVCQRRSARRKI